MARSYRTSMKNSLELLELSSVNKVMVWFPPVVTQVQRNDPYWTSRENSLEFLELSNINEVSLV